MPGEKLSLEAQKIEQQKAKKNIELSKISAQREAKEPSILEEESAILEYEQEKAEKLSEQVGKTPEELKEKNLGFVTNIFFGGTEEWTYKRAREEAIREIEKRREKYLEMPKEKGILGFFKRVKNSVKKSVFEYRAESIKQGLIRRYEIEIFEKLKTGDAELQKELQAAAEAEILEAHTEIYQTEENKEVGEKFNRAVQILLTQFVKGQINKEEFIQNKDELINTFLKENRNIFNKHEFVTDNLLELAEQIKAIGNHERALTNIDKIAKIQILRIKSALKTEADYTVVDKIVDYLRKHNSLNWINPTTVAVALGYLYSASQFVGGGAARMGLVGALGTAGATGTVALAFGMIRKNQELKSNYAIHTRQMALGGEIRRGSKIREAMEQFRIETLSARDITEQINKLLEKKDLSDEEYEILLNLATDIRARTRLADTETLDLIGYSGLETMDSERKDMLIALIKAQKMLRDNFKDEGDFNEFLNDATEARMIQLQKEISEKSQEFQRWKAKAMLKSGAQAAAIGIAAGFAMHELIGWYYREFGAIENIGKETITPLTALKRYITGERPMMSLSETDIYQLGKGGSIKLPKGVALIKNKDGSFGLFNSVDKEILINYLHCKDDGELTTESMRKLQDLGINVLAAKKQVVETVLESKTVSSEDIITGKGGRISNLFERVYRNIWYDNDTPRRFDLNELRLWWGGRGNTGLTQNGDYIFDISQMTKGGSFHGSLRANVIEELKSGRLKLNLSMSRETQQYVASIPFNERGQAIIPKDSPLAKMFFENVDGRAVFRGRFAEVAQVVNEKNGHDVVRILATYEGKGFDSTSVEIPKEIIKNFTANVLEIPREYIISPPPIIPIFRRQPLESLDEPKTKHEEDIPIFVSGISSYGSEDIPVELIKKRVNPEFRDDFSPDYKSSSEFYIKYMEENAPENLQLARYYAEKMKPMSPKEKAIVIIPMRANEYHNVDTLLKNYTKQIDKDGKPITDEFRIIIHVNSIQEQHENNKKAIKEIERFKKEHPELQIDVISTTFRQKNFSLHRIRKLATDVAVLLANQRIANKNQDPIIISNDADLVRMNPLYMNSIIKTFEEDKNREIDFIKGELAWAMDDLVRYAPRAVVSTSLMANITAHHERSQRGYVLSGANTAFRGSVYCNIGGYLEGANGSGEDIALGKIIKEVRKNSIRGGIPNTRLETSSRRNIAAVLKGLPAWQQWSKETGVKASDTVAEKDFIEKIKNVKGLQYDFENPKEKERFLKDVEKDLNEFIKVYGLTQHSPSKKIITYSFGWEEGEDFVFDEKGRFKLNDSGLNKLIKHIQGWKNYLDKVEKLKETKRKFSLQELLEVLGIRKGTTFMINDRKFTIYEVDLPNKVVRLDKEIQEGPRTATHRPKTKELDLHTLIKHLTMKNEEYLNNSTVLSYMKAFT